MRFDVYGRFQVEVKRENDAWIAYRLGLGNRTRMNDVLIPTTLRAEEIATYSDDVLHELSGPGQRIELL